MISDQDRKMMDEAAIRSLVRQAMIIECKYQEMDMVHGSSSEAGEAEGGDDDQQQQSLAKTMTKDLSREICRSIIRAYARHAGIQA